MYGETNYGFTEEDEKVYRDIYTMPVMTDMMYRKVSEIVNSELDEYFYSEDRTAEEVAESIQNKVTQYLNENGYKNVEVVKYGESYELV